MTERSPEGEQWQEGHWPQVGVGVIVIREGEVLLGLRKGEHGGGKWAFPGGKQEKGEKVFETAKRELEEETGLEAIRFEKASTYADAYYKDEGRHFCVPFVLVEANGEPQVMEPKKCEKWEWFKWDDLPEPLFLPVQQIFEEGYRPPGV